MSDYRGINKRTGPGWRPDSCVRGHYGVGTRREGYVAETQRQRRDGAYGSVRLIFSRHFRRLARVQIPRRAYDHANPSGSSRRGVGARAALAAKGRGVIKTNKAGTGE